MKHALFLAMGLFVISTGTAHAGGGLAPTTSVILPSDGSGVTKVAMTFDLSELAEDSSVELQTAVLDWPMAGLTGAEATTCEAHEITSSWNPSGVSSGQATLDVAAEPAAVWEMDTLAYSRLGGFVRLGVKRLVSDWLASPSQNFGVVIVFKNLTSEDLNGRTASPRLRIGYVRNVTLSQ